MPRQKYQVRVHFPAHDSRDGLRRVPAGQIVLYVEGEDMIPLAIERWAEIPGTDIHIEEG